MTTPEIVALLILAYCDLRIAKYFYDSRDGIVRKVFIAHFLCLSMYLILQILGFANLWTTLPRLFTAITLVYLFDSKKRSV